MIITVTDKKRNNLALHLYMYVYKRGFGDIEGGWVVSITEKKKNFGCEHARLIYREHITYMYNPSQALPGVLHSVPTHLPSARQHLVEVLDQGEERGATCGGVGPAVGHQAVHLLRGVRGALHPVTAPQQLKQALHRHRGVGVTSQREDFP